MFCLYVIDEICLSVNKKLVIEKAKRNNII